MDEILSFLRFPNDESIDVDVEITGYWISKFAKFTWNYQQCTITTMGEGYPHICWFVCLKFVSNYNTTCEIFGE